MSSSETEAGAIDLTANLVLKEDYTFLVADDRWRVNATGADGQGSEQGLYSRDTRYLSSYAWQFDRAARQLLRYDYQPDHGYQHLAVMEGPSQVLAIKRDLKLTAGGLQDDIQVENSSLVPQSLTLRLELAADFADLFVARGWHDRPPGRRQHQLQRGQQDASLLISHQASDGVKQAVQLRFTPAPAELDERSATYRLELPPGTSSRVEVSTLIQDPLARPQPAPTYGEWRRAAPLAGVPPQHRAALERAVVDLRALLLFNQQGPMPAAGIPWFVTPFGRDALLTSYMMQPHYPEVARGTLRYLAHLQGTQHHAGRAEAPGKILHEVRHGELSRIGVVPFQRYYGTIDATALFVILLGRMLAMGHSQLVSELRPNLEAALAYLTTDADPDGDGFLEFSGAAPGQGLTVQSWKDSHDALSHADGRLASGAIAVSEVQGYAYAAYLVAADCFSAFGQPQQASAWRQRAQQLKQRFHEAFWLPELGTFALALDHDKRPLRVLASDAGQLLWTGIVHENVAPTLVATLMSPQLFSGWGIRTLGTAEHRYNPLSYHNGSVWPHDTALIAAGMWRYGFLDEALTLRDALFDVAASQPDLRPPELIAGYPRRSIPPVPYPAACRPQAWSSAALLYLSGLELPGA